jgi:hypothetical protein
LRGALVLRGIWEAGAEAAIPFSDEAVDVNGVTLSQCPGEEIPAAPIAAHPPLLPSSERSVWQRGDV